MPRFVCFAVLAVFGAFQDPPPATDVFVASFSSAGGNITIGKPVNISNNPGYDNQPSFTPDGAAVLFTSVRGDRKPDPGNPAQSGSDIYRYDLASGQLSQVTSTGESEYSPTVTPDGKHISVIQVERDGTQRLWRFALAGGEPDLILRDVKPVGYHAWADAKTLALFVLGTPATLQVADLATGKSEIVASDIGRSILKIPGGGISVVHRESIEGERVLVVKEFDPATKQLRSLVRMLKGVNAPDLAWTPDGTLLVAADGKLHAWRRGAAAFEVAADLASAGLRNVSRMAISPAGDRIAVVAQQ
jgi:Tol biopolymer transport system component